MTTNAEVTIIDPKDYGLEAKNTKEIEVAFSPKIKEREELSKVYALLIKKEVSEEACEEARDLRLKLVKVRTGISDIHKTQKAYFLAAGKFVDAWKNKETEPVKQMEEKLSDIEKHFEKLEDARIEKLREERQSELTKYGYEFLTPNLGEMEESVWLNFVSGVKLGCEAKKKQEEEAEKERKELEAKAEAERLAKIEQDKKERQELEAKEKAQRIENERLRKEAKEKADKIAKEEEERKAAQKIKDDAAAKLLADERAKALKLQEEIKAKAEKEAKEKADKIASDKAAAQAPDKDKLIKLLDELKITALELNTTEAKAAYNVITAKFNGFKTWATQQIESIK